MLLIIRYTIFFCIFFFFQAEDGIRDLYVTGVQTCALPISEGWAFLMEHMVDDPAWLQRRLDFGDPGGLAADSAVSLLWLSRRYCAKLLYEIELHQSDDLPSMKSRYVELLSDALKIAPSETDWLADVDGGFYSTEYLRAWAFEA